MLSLPAFAKYLTDGFRVAKMRIDLPFHPEWETEIDEELFAILDQPFHYIDKGSQCYVFESLDHKYVIKFFRFSNPNSKLKISTLFNATHIAYTSLKEETGLIYIHLNRTKNCLPTLHCKDAIGRSYKFHLDECRFAIQKRAESVHSAFKKALHNPSLMQNRIDQFVALLILRTEKGICNADPSLSRNFGFLENRAIEIDFGNYRSVIPHSKEQEIERFAKKLRHLLQKEAPEWVLYLDQEIARSLKN